MHFSKKLVVFFVIAGLLFSLYPQQSFAQFAPPTAPPPGGQPITSGGIGGGVSGRLPYWYTSSSLGNSNLEWNSTDNALRLRGANSGYVELKAPTDGSGSSFTFPDADGAAGQVLSTDGNGVLTWADPGIGGGTGGYGGTGADGVCCSVNTTLNTNAQHPTGVYNFSTFTVPAGVTVTVDNGLNPIRIYSKNNVVIDGTLTAKGTGANGGSGGYFGYSSTPIAPTAGQQGINTLYPGGGAGNNQTWWVHGPDATCPYGTCVTSNPSTPGGSGAGASSGGGSTPPSGSGALYVALTPGAGGGGGGTSYAARSAYCSGCNPYDAVGNGPGGNGGKGGGSFMIETPGSITVGSSGIVTAQGNDATIGAISYTTFWTLQYCGGIPIYPRYVQQASAGGGGGGGTVYLRSSDLTNRSITYTAGKSFVEEGGVSAKGGTGGNQLPRGAGSCSSYYQYGSVFLTQGYSAFGPAGGGGTVFYEKIDATAGPSILSGGQADKIAIWADAGNLYNDYSLHWDNITKRLGVGTATPQTTVDVNGTVRTSNLQITSGTIGTPGDGKILVSDANGNARWVSNPWTTGTTSQNYVAKFGNTTQLTNSQIFDNGTSVGIGTNTPDPAKKLDVVGDVQITKLNVTQDFTISGEPILAGGSGGGVTVPPFRFSRTLVPSTYSYGYYYANTTTDRDGICSSDFGANYKAATSYDAQIYGGGATSGTSFVTYDSGTGSYKFSASAQTFWGYPYYSYGAAAYSGVSLASNSPYGVAGPFPVACISRGGGSSSDVITGNGVSGKIVYWQNNTDLNQDNVFAWDAINKRLGVNIATPTTTLDVNGTIKISGGSPGVGKVLVSDAMGVASWAAGVTGSGTTNYISKWTSASAQGASQIFDNGTNVGVGNISPGYKLDVAGNINANSLCIGGDCRSSWGAVGGGGGGSGGSTAWIQFTRAGMDGYSNGDAQCLAELGSNFRQASKADLLASWNSSMYIGSTGYFNLLDGLYYIYSNAGTYYTAQNLIRNNYPQAGYSVACVNKNAPLQFTRAGMDGYSNGDAQCLAELGSNFRQASKADLLASWNSSMYIGSTGYFNLLDGLYYIYSNAGTYYTAQNLIRNNYPQAGYSVACVNKSSGGSGGGGLSAGAMSFSSNPGGTSLSACPSGWTDMGSSYKSGEGGAYYRRTCYRSDKACTSMSVEGNAGGSAPSCPSGWSLANSSYRYEGGQYIQTNTCYICAP